jgi:hypothetical protein
VSHYDEASRIIARLGAAGAEKRADEVITCTPAAEMTAQRAADLTAIAWNVWRIAQAVALLPDDDPHLREKIDAARSAVRWAFDTAYALGRRDEFVEWVKTHPPRP